MVLDEVPESVASEGNPERGLLESERRMAIWRTIQLLDADHRTVVVLHYYQDMSIAEIASLLEIPAGTVKSRLHTARKRIERTLDTA
jgi:RNA polymerase sigma-70 factor (ECF subfamily)